MLLKAKSLLIHLSISVDNRSQSGILHFIRSLAHLSNLLLSPESMDYCHDNSGPRKIPAKLLPIIFCIQIHVLADVANFHMD